MSIHNASIKIKARRREIFTVLTKPELVKLWQYNKIISTTWEPGKEILFLTNYNNNELKQWGTVLEFIPNELIKYNLFTPKPGLSDKIENYTSTTYALTRVSDGTIIELTQEDPHTDFFQPVSLMPILVTLKNTVEQIYGSSL